MAVTDAVLDELVRVTSRRLGAPITADPDWRPAVQGAVGQVVGLRSGRAGTYAAKVFAAGARRRAGTEIRGIQLAAPVLGQVVPGIVDDGVLPLTARPYVVMTRLAVSRQSSAPTDGRPRASLRGDRGSASARPGPRRRA